MSGEGPRGIHAVGDFDGDGDIDAFSIGGNSSSTAGCSERLVSGHWIWFNTTEVGSCLDFDGDGEVGGSELTLIIGNWGSPEGDITGDGTTDGQDLTVILANWGPCGA